MRKKQSCKMIAHDAHNTTTKARECIKSMQPLLGRRQLTLNPISSEIFKTSKVVKFGGDAFPHFFIWKKDALDATARLGIPLADQGSYIKSYLKGEAQARVNAELASVSHPTTQQVLEILEHYFGLPFVIMKQLIKAHQAYGKIPSHNEASWRTVHQTVNNH